MTKRHMPENDDAFWKRYPWDQTPAEKYYDFLYPNYHPIRNTSKTLGDCAKLVANPNAEKLKRKLTWKDFVPTKPQQFKKKKRGRKKGGNSLKKMRNKWMEKKMLDKFSRHGKVKNTRKKWSVGVGFFKQVFVNTTKWFLGTKSAWGIFCFGRWKTQNFSALRAEKFNVNKEFTFSCSNVSNVMNLFYINQIKT